MDKSWMKRSRASNAYDEGLRKFLDFAFEKSSSEGKISCPCKKCRLLLPATREEAYDHLIVDGFIKEYTTCVFHGEVETSTRSSNVSRNLESSEMDIDMNGLLNDAFGFSNLQNHTESETHANYEDQPHAEAQAFYNLVKDANKELYPGCKSHTTLSFIVQLFNIKCLGNWSDNSFGLLLKLLKIVFPEGETLPETFYEAKKIIKALGLDYEKIHACPNDCILYRKEYQDRSKCPKCHMSRYVEPEPESTSSSSSSDECSKVPAKAFIVLYFTA